MVHTTIVCNHRIRCWLKKPLSRASALLMSLPLLPLLPILLRCSFLLVFALSLPTLGISGARKPLLRQVSHAWLWNKASQKLTRFQLGPPSHLPDASAITPSVAHTPRRRRELLPGSSPETMVISFAGSLSRLEDSQGQQIPPFVLPPTESLPEAAPSVQSEPRANNYIVFR